MPLFELKVLLKRFLITLGTDQGVTNQQKYENSAAEEDKRDIEGRFSHFMCFHHGVTENIEKLGPLTLPGDAGKAKPSAAAHYL